MGGPGVGFEWTISQVSLSRSLSFFFLDLNLNLGGPVPDEGAARDREVGNTNEGGASGEDTRPEPPEPEEEDHRDAGGLTRREFSSNSSDPELGSRYKCALSSATNEDAGDIEGVCRGFEMGGEG